MRKILISSGYGGGWVSWNTRFTKEQKVFMLEYPPFIEAVEAGKNPADLADEFMEDFKKKFPEIGDDPYVFLGGLHKLEVEEIEDNVGVQIRDCDGNESIVCQYEEWL